MDVIVFIPKAAGTTGVSSQRPLAIPNTILRLLSSAGMAVVAKPWAGLLHQAATALPGKGDCASNVRTLQSFIDWYQTCPTYTQATFSSSLCHLLPSHLSSLLTSLLPFLTHRDLIRILAFIDQVKAYEVLSYEWLIACWQ